MLTRLKVKNFRCIKEADVPLDNLVAFVGPNGVGKTTLLHAINFLLGDSWPSLRGLRVPQDFYDFDTTQGIEIDIYFTPPYLHSDSTNRQYSVCGIEYVCEPYQRNTKHGEVGDLHDSLQAVDENGEKLIVPTGRRTKNKKPEYLPLTVSTNLRDHARVLFIDHRRSIAQHVPSARGSLLSRLLLPARKEFKPEEGFKQAYEQAMDFLRTDRVREIEQRIEETTKRMLGFLGKYTAQSVKIGFGFADPANPFNSLRLQYTESDRSVPGEDLGLGIQSAIIVGVFEAFRQLGGNFGTLIIEEPEMYLHPQAQRYFFRLLCELSEKQECQVIYSTHSPIFADVNKFETIRLVRKLSQDSTKVFYVDNTRRADLDNARNRHKIGGRFNTDRNEVLFANKAVLVEGYGDKVAVLRIAEKMRLDFDAEGITVVDCGGKSGILLIVQVCKAFQIPFVVIHDEDILPIENMQNQKCNKNQQEENELERKNNQKIREAVEDETCLFILKPSLEECLGVSRNAKDKPQKVAEAIEKIDILNPPKEIEPLIQAIKHITASDADEQLENIDL